VFIYSQSTGELTRDGQLIGTGYAGHGSGKNDPQMQQVPNVGPLPQGFYTIGLAEEHARLGPMSMELDPDPDNQMFDRSEFFIHGDNPDHVGNSSDGCIVMPPAVRQAIAASGDDLLQVTA
jgi:hypothetical protein